MESKDCDVAIDRMMGRTFASQLHKFLTHKQVPSSSFGVMQANPERSKHLETATLTMFGYPLDFVNLRAESYSDDSRIPSVVAFGTPSDDAHRRDITINALFYNLSTRNVEDYCGRSFDDLSKGIIRTPLEPRETLLDDPLRLLRVVRFATRLSFAIEEGLQAAIRDPVVQAAFTAKISRERVGHELGKILTDVRCLNGLETLIRLDAMHLIFNVADVTVSKETFSLILQTFAALTAAPADATTNAAAGASAVPYNRRLALLASICLPYYGRRHACQPPHVRGAGGDASPYSYSSTSLYSLDLSPALSSPPLPALTTASPSNGSTGSNGKAKRTEPLVTAIIRDAIKFPSSDVVAIDKIHAQVEGATRIVMESFSPAFTAAGQAGLTAMLAGAPHVRIAVGRVIRAVGANWQAAFYTACVNAAITRRPPSDDVPQSLVGLFRAAIEAIHEVHLDGAWSWGPILSGAQIQHHLALPAGPAIGAMLERMWDWQLCQGQGAKAEEAVAHLKLLAQQ